MNDFRSPRTLVVPARLISSELLKYGTSPSYPRRRASQARRAARPSRSPPPDRPRPRPHHRHRLRLRPPHAHAPLHFRRHPHGPRGRALDRLSHGRFRLHQDPHRPPAVEPPLPPVEDAARWPRPRSLHGFQHGPSLRPVHGDDPRCPPYRPGPSPADHRRRPARGVPAVRPL